MPKEKHSKRYRDLKTKTSHNLLEVEDALRQAQTSATAKFDESIELHFATNADPRHADQTLREVVSLPHSLGDVVKVLVFAEGDAAVMAKEAGADYVVDSQLMERIESGWTDWNVSLATHDQMPKVGRLGRILGPRGLMPNPRNNTVVQPENLESAIRSAHQGRLEIRMDRQANLHAKIGKKSFSDKQLIENLYTVYETVTRAKPEGVKGTFLRSASVCAAMGPSFRINLASLDNLIGNQYN